MADQAQDRIVESVTTPQHNTPPSVRELRTQSVHRLQVGLLGMCAMLLLVGLANIIMERAMLSEDKTDPTEEVIAVDAEPKKPAADPLADIGVVPSADPTPEPEPDVEADLLQAE